ncbi:hypothetical protein FZC35_02140 [Candidatus Cytomitobacter indipagum]|uniref:Uncharacterized protein n=1 Tax=Candidatus Cytomitobacter indipagum TaxID=2601575 RepID=A0A5C0UDN7_9PROT|nr:hypothetical protein [Candidatus Cytomitobacter indipagum]QEK38165.1 hypothetical protein FZC35_02140 [Candidatus Cytomitobacter indipagum]
MNILKNILHFHNKTTNYIHDKYMCILCAFWIVPFLAGMTIVWISALIILFGLSLFIPFFMSMFVLLSIAFALVNIVTQAPLLGILFIGALFLFRDQINYIWNQLFIAKSYSIQKPSISGHTPMILSLFIIHALMYIMPIPTMWKFGILALMSAYMFKKTNHDNCDQSNHIHHHCCDSNHNNNCSKK